MEKIYASFDDAIAEVEDYITNCGFKPCDWNTAAVAEECYRALDDRPGYECVADQDAFTDALERNAYHYRVTEIVGVSVVTVGWYDFRADAMAGFKEHVALAGQKILDSIGEGDESRVHYIRAERATRGGDWVIFANADLVFCNEE